MSLSKRVKENIADLVFLAVFLTFFVVALDFSPRAQFMPMVVSAMAMVTIVAEMLVANFGKGMATGIDTAELFGADKKEEEFREASLAKAEQEAVQVLAPAGGDEKVMFLWIGLLTLMIVLVGFSVTEFLFPVIYLRFASHLSWKASVGIGVATWLLIYLFFGVLLKLPFFPGLLFGGELY